MKMKTNWMASIFAVILCGCSNSPRGFYVSETPRSTYCLEFKSHGKVIIRDLTSSYFAEQNYTVEKKVIRIDAFKVAGVTSAIEFSIDGNRLINANGLQFKKDTSGKTYTPLERVAEANKLTAQAELTQRQVALKEKEKEVAELKIKSEREKASAEQQRLAALSRLEQDRIAALSKQAEEEQARAIEQSKLDKENAKRYAAAHGWSQWVNMDEEDCRMDKLREQLDQFGLTITFAKTEGSDFEWFKVERKYSLTATK